MIHVESPFESLESCTPRADFSSDDELADYEIGYEHTHESDIGYGSDQNSPQPTMRRFRSFSAGKLVVPSKLTAETQLRDLEARLVEKENEVLLAADIGQVLLKEIDSLKHKLAVYEQIRTPDDFNQEIEVKHAETLQKLKTFRVEAEIYTCSFEKPSKNGNSPYATGRRGERSVTPQLSNLTDSELDLTRIPSPTMLTTKNTTSTLHSEISKSVEVGENLMKLSRQLQTKLLEAERESLNLAEKVTEQERQTMAFKMQLVRGAESEAKSQENSWNLELSNQELQTQVEELEQAMQKLTNDHMRLQEALNQARESIEHLHLKEEKMSQMMERTKTRHEQELVGVRKLVSTLQGEKTELQRKLDEIKNERSSKSSKHMGKYFNNPITVLDTTNVDNDSNVDLSDGHEHSPIRSPSPSPFGGSVPGQTLQVETLRGSLNHAHRTIASLRACLHREKIEKLEFKKMLAENQETLETLQHDSLLETEGNSTTSPNNDPEVPRKSLLRKIRRRKCGSKRASAPVFLSRNMRNQMRSDSSISSDESTLTIEEGLSYPSFEKTPTGQVSFEKPRNMLNESTMNVEKDITMGENSSDGDQKIAELSARRNTRNPLARRSAQIAMPNRDLLNELSMCDDHQSLSKESQNLKMIDELHSTSNVTTEENQTIQNLLRDIVPSLCKNCGAAVGVLMSGSLASSRATDYSEKRLSNITINTTSENLLKVEEEASTEDKVSDLVISVPKDHDALANQDERSRINSDAVIMDQERNVVADNEQLQSADLVEANVAITQPGRSEITPKRSVSAIIPPPRPTTLPPAELMTLTLSPMTLRNSVLLESDVNQPTSGHEVMNTNHKRPPIPSSMLQPFDPRNRNAEINRPSSGINSKGKRAFYGKEIDTVIGASSNPRPTSRYFSEPAMDASYSRHQSLRRPNTQGMRPTTINSNTTDSSYFGDEGTWSSRRRPFSADPAIIHAITQAMIGNFMYKYTRKAIGSGMSEKKHKRYFWIHPYTKTINWSVEQPGPEKTFTRNGTKSKSAYVKSVRVIQEPSSPTSPTSNDQAGYEYSLVIETSTRELKIKAMDSDKHDVWLLALTYLQTRQVISGPAAEQYTSGNDTEGNNYSTMQTSHQNSTNAHPQTLSKKRSLTRLFKRPSKSNLNGTLAAMEFPPSTEDLEALEDIKKCCKGKHDINRLETVMH